MLVVDIRRYEMLARVKEFGATHAEVFPATSLGGQTFAVVATAVDSLKAQLAAEASGRTRQALASKASARHTLRDAVETIARTARAIETDTPGMEGKFVMPRSRNDQKLLAAARAFVADGPSFADAFLAHNLPSTFVADLTTAIDALERAILDHSTVREANAASKATIQAALESGSAAVQRLDAIVENKLRGDEEALAMWTTLRRISHIGLGGGRPVTPPAVTDTTKAA
ncbi:MAG TPA: hypothetical protein VFA59_16960 [Vicinamibacterales bacterium]|nr:hypothetical protein [Vicinamibacterales bacterium]